MTVTHYIAEFVDEAGKGFVGQVYWDKHYQRSLQVSICPRESAQMLGYAVWQTSGPYEVQNRAEMNRMVGVMKTQAKRLGLSLKSERLTDYAPPETP